MPGGPGKPTQFQRPPTSFPGPGGGPPNSFPGPGGGPPNSFPGPGAGPPTSFAGPGGGPPNSFAGPGGGQPRSGVPMSQPNQVCSFSCKGSSTFFSFKGK